MCRLSWNLGTSTSLNPLGLSRAVIGLLYFYLYLLHVMWQSIKTTIYINEIPHLKELSIVHWNIRELQPKDGLKRKVGTCSWHVLFFFNWRDSRQCAMASSSTRFLDHTQRRTTVGRTPLEEWSARRRDLCLTTHNTHNTEIPMPPVGFEPTISAGYRPQTHA